MNKKQIAVICFIIFILSPVISMSVPVISADKDTIVCDNILLNEIKKYAVNISNNGDSVLRIDKIRSSCKCLSGKLVKTGNELQPGETVPLEIILDTAGLYGKKEYFLMIHNNDEQNQTVKISVIVSVISPREPVIAVFPETLNFGLIKDGKAGARLLIKNPGGSDLAVVLNSKVIGIFFSDTSFTISAGQKKNIEISAEPDLIKKLTPSEKMITVSSNAVNSKNIEIAYSLKS